MFSDLLLLFSLFSLIAACPQNAFQWQSSCYIFEATPTAFVAAEEACTQIKGHLSSVHSGFTNAFLAQQAFIEFPDSAVSDAWIGATTFIIFGNFSWTDGSNFDFTNWGKLGNLTGEDCVGLNTINGLWQSEDCFKQKPYICQIIPEITTTTSTTTTTTRTTTTTKTTKATTTKPKQCPDDWTYLSTTRSCYGHLGYASWTDGEIICNTYGAHLISIHSEVENTFVHTLELQAGHFIWIGVKLNLTDIFNHNIVSWTDGTSYDYKNWHKGVIYFDEYSCGNYGDSDLSDSWYNDTPCDSKQPFYCKKPAAF